MEHQHDAGREDNNGGGITRYHKELACIHKQIGKRRKQNPNHVVQAWLLAGKHPSFETDRDWPCNGGSTDFVPAHDEKV